MINFIMFNFVFKELLVENLRVILFLVSGNYFKVFSRYFVEMVVCLNSFLVVLYLWNNFVLILFWEIVNCIVLM